MTMATRRLRVVVCDDEALARARLRRLLEEVPEAEIVGEAASGGEAVELAFQLRPDVVFLDIRMPGVDGLEAAWHLLAAPGPPAVIFTTAYPDHALAAFEAQAADYLLKPIRRERLVRALARLADRLPGGHGSTPEGQRMRRYLSARAGACLFLIPVRDIHYFRADHKYVEVHHQEGRALVEDSLRALEAEFGDQFIRTHRSILVSRAALVALHRSSAGRHQVELRGVPGRLEVSRRHLPMVRACFAAGRQEGDRLAIRSGD